MFVKSSQHGSAWLSPTFMGHILYKQAATDCDMGMLPVPTLAKINHKRTSTLPRDAPWLSSRDGPAPVKKRDFENYQIYVHPGQSIGQRPQNEPYEILWTYTALVLLHHFVIAEFFIHGAFIDAAIRSNHPKQWGTFWIVAAAVLVPFLAVVFCSN